MADVDRWLERVVSVRRWTRRGERAPHKPLLLLYAIGRWQRTGTSRVSFAEAEEPLGELLSEFGPPRSTTPAYPFHHLQSDGLWAVTTEDGSEPGAAVRRLRESGATGRLSDELEAALDDDARLAVLIARALLDESWPPSLHGEICAAVGLDLESLEADAVHERVAELERHRRRRDPRFRHRILVAYEYRCAMCGYDGRLRSDTVGLDAAHVRWWAFDGPEDVTNGLSLCAFHHRLFDRGVLSLTAERTVTVSQEFVGRGDVAERLVLALAGAPLLAPQRGQPRVSRDHARWHHTQVFRGPARAPAA